MGAERVTENNGFHMVSRSEIWRALTDLEQMTPGSSPLVRQVEDTKTELAGMKWKLYLTIGALGSGLLVSALLRLTGISPTP